MMTNNQQEKASRGSSSSIDGTNASCESNHKSLEDLSSSGGDDATLSLSRCLKPSHAPLLMFSKAGAAATSDHPNDDSLKLALA